MSDDLFKLADEENSNLHILSVERIRRDPYLLFENRPLTHAMHMWRAINYDRIHMVDVIRAGDMGKIEALIETTGKQYQFRCIMNVYERDGLFDMYFYLPGPKVSAVSKDKLLEMLSSVNIGWTGQFQLFGQTENCWQIRYYAGINLTGIASLDLSEEIKVKLFMRLIDNLFQDGHHKTNRHLKAILELT